MLNPREFGSAADLRAWLAEHHEAEDDLWVAFEGVAPGRSGLRFADAAAAAASAGWVEVGRAGLEGARYAVCFAPGEVPEAPAADPHASSWAAYRKSGKGPALGPEYEAELMANEAAWAFFREQRPAYQRAAIWWVISAAHEETRDRRFTKLVETSARGEKLPQVTRNL